MTNPTRPARRSGTFQRAMRLSLAVAALSCPALASDGSTSVRLPDSTRFPESVTSDANGTLFVSSIADGGVLKVVADGAVTSQFLKPGDHGTRFTFGLLADPERGVLWVASNDATALGAKGPNLYVNTVMSGELFRIAMNQGAAGAVTQLETTRPPKFPDGLRAFKDGFLMVEGSGALSRVTVSGNSARIEPIGQFAGPTGVTVAGDRIWVSEGQLGLMSRQAEAGGEAPSFHLRSVDVQ